MTRSKLSLIPIFVIIHYILIGLNKYMYGYVLSKSLLILWQ